MVDIVVGNDKFGDDLAKTLGRPFVEVKEEYYPDGEATIRISSDYEAIEGKEVVLAMRTKWMPTVESTLKYIHATQRAIGSLTDKQLFNAKSVDLMWPYFVFGRQDHNPRTDPNADVRKRDKGKDLGYQHLLKTFSALGARKVITFDPHFYRQESTRTECGLEIVALSGVYALARGLQDYSDNAVVISPDKGGSSLSENLAGLLGLSSTALSKMRMSGEDVTVGDVYDARGKNLIFVDDIISTAGTLEKRLDSIKNASKIFVACVHPVLPTVGYNRLKRLSDSGVINRIVATDTIDSSFSMTSVIPEVVTYLEYGRI